MVNTYKALDGNVLVIMCENIETKYLTKHILKD